MAKPYMEVWTSTNLEMFGRGKMHHSCTLRIGKAQYPFLARQYRGLKEMLDTTRDDQVYGGEVIFGTSGDWRAILQLRHISPPQVVFIVNGAGTVRRVEDQTKINALKAMIALEGDDHSLINEHLEKLFNEYPDSGL